MNFLCIFSTTILISIAFVVPLPAQITSRGIHVRTPSFILHVSLIKMIKALNDKIQVLNVQRQTALFCNTCFSLAAFAQRWSFAQVTCAGSFAACLFEALSLTSILK